MFGFLIGTACLIGLIKVIRHGRCGGHGYGPPWARGRHGGCGSSYGQGRWGGFEGHGGPESHGGPEGWGGQEGGWGRGRGFGGGFWGGRGFMLRALFQALDTTPGQEKVIAAAVEEMREASSKIREEVKRSRVEVAKAMRGGSFDEVMMGELFAKHDEAIEALRRASVGAIGKVHEALDEKQRARLADLIEHGPSHFRGWRS